MSPGPSSSPEAPPVSSSPESSDDDDSKKKKKIIGSAATAPIRAEAAGDKPVEPARQNIADLIMQRLKGEKSASPKPEVPLFGVTKPETEAPSKPGSIPEMLIKPDSGNKAAGSSDETKVDSLSTAAAELSTSKRSAGAETEASTDSGEIGNATSLTELEQKQAAAAIAGSRLEAAIQERQEIPEEHVDSIEAAETDSRISLLRALKEQLHMSDGKPAADIIDETAAETERQIATPLAEQYDDGNPDGSPEDIPEAPDMPGAGEQSVPMSHEHAAAPPPIGPPEGPPPPPFTGMPEGNPGDPEPGRGPGDRFGGPDDPFRSPISGSGAELPFAMAAPLGAAEAATKGVVSAESTGYNEQAAQNRGLLVGGIVGYLIGNRRGKKKGRAASEKHNAPIRRNLEQQVKQLHDTIVAKEQQIKRVTSEKMHAVMKSKEHAPVPPAGTGASVAEAAAAAERTSDAVSARSAPAAEMRPAATVGGREVVTIPGPVRPVGELYSRSAEPAGALLAAAGAELLINDRYSREFKPPVPAAATGRTEQALIIPFTKKAEDFSRQELMQTAEKITVQGVKLKEMVDLGRINERSLRKIVAEFLEGGDVSKALAREIQEKEMKFERDPRLRQTDGSSSGQADGGGAAAAAGALAHDSGGTGSSLGTAGSDGTTGQPYAGPKPVPDSATLQAIKQRQAATVAGTTVLVIAAVYLLLNLSR
ncbi:MAG TPA: hypothetical protein VF572_02725 [Candidatus Saccharimonadales bacterium]